MGSKPVRSKFFIILEPGKKSEIFFSGKIGIFLENIGIYQKNQRFFADFFSSDFSTRKSFPAPPKTDFLPKNRSKKPIFLSMSTTRIPINLVIAKRVNYLNGLLFYFFYFSVLILFLFN